MFQVVHRVRKLREDEHLFSGMLLHEDLSQRLQLGVARCIPFAEIGPACCAAFVASDSRSSRNAGPEMTRAQPAESSSVPVGVGIIDFRGALAGNLLPFSGAPAPRFLWSLPRLHRQKCRRRRCPGLRRRIANPEAPRPSCRLAGPCSFSMAWRKMKFRRTCRSNDSRNACPLLSRRLSRLVRQKPMRRLPARDRSARILPSVGVGGVSGEDVT